jgi:hypothetical protein
MKVAMSVNWGIPRLKNDMLCQSVPDEVFLWRTKKLSAARGCTVAFYVDDYRLDPLWRRPEHYAKRLLDCGINTVIEVDFSTWRDDPLIVQAYNVYRMRALSRCWQSYGIRIIPNLAWADERSYAFCFEGIPIGAPVVACECRTAGQTDADRRMFLKGLSEAVRQVRPECIIVYGGTTHRFWLEDRLPLLTVA